MEDKKVHDRGTICTKAAASRDREVVAIRSIFRNSSVVDYLANDEEKR